MKKGMSIVAAMMLAMICFAAVACGTVSEKQQLSKPREIYLDGRTLVWKAVENAIGYRVMVNGAIEDITEPGYDLSALQTVKKYTVEIQSRGDGTYYVDSEKTVYEYTPEKIVDRGVDKIGLEYTLLPDSSGYEVSRGSLGHSDIRLAGVLEIPHYFHGLPVTQIASWAFRHDGSEKVNGFDFFVVPSPFTGQYCNKVTTAVRLPKHLKKIGDEALAYLWKIESVEIPDSVEEIGEGAFKGCASLKSVKLPKNLKTIPDDCFNYCALKEITLPSGLTTIGDSAFNADAFTLARTEQDIKIIIIPDGVTSIGAEAFAGCLYLEEIVIPASVKTLGNSMFRGCEKLKRIYYGGTETEWRELSKGIADIMSARPTIYYYSEARPSMIDNRWHFDSDNRPVMWI